MSGTGIAAFGRDSLLEELVAFANTDGVVIVLDIDETDEKPPRAKSIEALPHVVALERSLQDAVIDCIEPRLPFAAVKAIQIGEDGCGLIFMETQPSTLGPHWVRPTRRAKVRREDRSDMLSMPEIHDMVLRKSRRFDEVTRRLAEARDQFERYFLEIGNHMRPRKQQALENWLMQDWLSLIGIRVTVVPHQNLGIARLETVEDLEPKGSITRSPPAGQTKGYQLMHPPALTGRRVVGGIVTSLDTTETKRRACINRDGYVESTVVWHQPAARAVKLSWLLGIAGSTLGYYENLLHRAAAPSMDAEVDAEILAKGDCRPAIEEEYWGSEGNRLGFRTQFPSTTISDFSDFHDYLTELAGDFANAGGHSAASLPRFTLNIQRGGK
jgi:hypothetical protein